MSDNVLKNFDKILGALNEQTLETIDKLLTYYNGAPVLIDGIYHHPFNDPQIAARLNARYHELTGQDHSTFLEQAPLVIDRLLQDKDMLINAGAYTPMYFDNLNKIKDGITNEQSRMEISESNEHPLLKFHKVLENLENASLEDVTQQLDYFNGEPVLLNGTSYHPFNNPQTAARLNARYHKLTGQDHPTFLEQAPLVIDELLQDKDMLINAGAYTPMYFDNLNKIKDGITNEQNRMEISESNEHPLLKFHKVLENLENASLEDVTQQLDYFNGEPVLLNGTSYHPFNNPQTAARLNARYHKLTGQDHPTFLEQAPLVIDRLLQDKDMLINTGAYTPMYFDNLNKIKDGITKEEISIEETPSIEDSSGNKKRIGLLQGKLSNLLSLIAQKIKAFSARDTQTQSVPMLPSPTEYSSDRESRNTKMLEQIMGCSIEDYPKKCNEAEKSWADRKANDFTNNKSTDLER